MAVILESDHPRPSPTAPAQVLKGKPSAAGEDLFKWITMRPPTIAAHRYAIVPRHQVVAAFAIASQQEQRPCRITIHFLIRIPEHDDLVSVSIAVDIRGRAVEDRKSRRDVIAHRMVLRRCGGGIEGEMGEQ